MKFSSLHCTHGQKVTTAVVFLSYIEQLSIENEHTFQFKTKRKKQTAQAPRFELFVLESFFLFVFWVCNSLIISFFLSLSLSQIKLEGKAASKPLRSLHQPIATTAASLLFQDGTPCWVFTECSVSLVLIGCLPSEPHYIATPCPGSVILLLLVHIHLVLPFFAWLGRSFVSQRKGPFLLGVHLKPLLALRGRGYRGLFANVSLSVSSFVEEVA